MSKDGPEKKPLVFRLNDHGQGPDLVREVFLERGWVEFDEDVQSETDWNVWWRTSRFRMCDYQNLCSWQRLNHYPKSSGITKKDCLVRHLKRMKGVHGSSMYNFSPLSFNLPNDYTRYVAEYEKLKSKTDPKQFAWICKPADLSRGRGIFLFRDISELQYDCNAVVQQYIANPLLIGGYKFDIRLYVAVPSFHPLTIYVFQEGIVRFGTEKYDLNALNNVFAHLTNTSINKFSPSYTADKERVGPGCKWTLTQLRYYFHQNSLDDQLLWTRIRNIIVLTLLIQAPQVPKEKNCYELYGFDVLIDENLKPWLMEVNFSPALATDCQIDNIVKKPMLHDLMDMLNFKESDAERGGADKQMKTGRVTNRARMSANKTKAELVDRNMSSSRLSQRGSMQRNGSTISAMLKSIEPPVEPALSFIQQDNPSIQKVSKEMCYGLPLVNPCDDDKDGSECHSRRSSVKSDVIEADIYALYSGRTGRFTPSSIVPTTGRPILERSFGSFERSGTTSSIKNTESIHSNSQRGDKASLKSFGNSDSAYSSFSDNSEKTGSNTDGKTKVFSRRRKSYSLQSEVLSETPRESEVFHIQSLRPNENSRSLKRLANRGVTPVNGKVSFRSKTKVSIPNIEKNLNKSRTFDRAPSRNFASRSTSRFGNVTTRSEMDYNQKNRAQAVVSSMSNISKANTHDKEIINLALTGTSKQTSTGHKFRQKKSLTLHSRPPKGPPPKVGDFFLVFPFNEGTFKAAHSTLDPHIVIKEAQKVIRELKLEIEKESDDRKIGGILPYGAAADSERLWAPVKLLAEDT